MRLQRTKASLRRFERGRHAAPPPLLAQVAERKAGERREGRGDGCHRPGRRVDRPELAVGRPRKNRARGRDLEELRLRQGRLEGRAARRARPHLEAVDAARRADGEEVPRRVELDVVRCREGRGDGRGGRRRAWLELNTAVRRRDDDVVGAAARLDGDTADRAARLVDVRRRALPDGRRLLCAG
jgi:hypothetical protein